MLNTSLNTARSYIAGRLHDLAARFDVLVPSESIPTMRTVTVCGTGFPAGVLVGETSDAIDLEGRIQGKVKWSATTDAAGRFAVCAPLPSSSVTLSPSTSFDGTVTVIQDETA